MTVVSGARHARHPLGGAVWRFNRLPELQRESVLASASAIASIFGRGPSVVSQLNTSVIKMVVATTRASGNGGNGKRKRKAETEN